MWNFEFDNGHKATQKFHVPEFTFLLKWSPLSSSIREFNKTGISLNGCSVNFKQCQFCRVYDSLVKNVLEARNWASKLSYDTTWLVAKDNLQIWLRDMMTRANGHEVVKSYWTRHGQEVFRFNISAIVICDN